MTTSRSRAKRKPAQDNGQEMTTEQAAEMLQKEGTERAGKCAAKITEALKEFNCQIDIIEITRNGVLEASRIDIRPLQAGG